ncbi:MAG TPA: GrpB family protein, partial [Gammaproteobacteria bacterium]
MRSCDRERRPRSNQVESEQDESVFFVPEAAVREKIARRFDHVKRQLLGLLPLADIQHVGSTAIPGSFTKGDLDIQV